MSARDYWLLTKPGITRHVVITAAAGYWLGHGDSWPRLAILLAGTALVSGGTNGLNQWWERDVDARMPRTRSRPIASGRVSANSALAFCAGLGVLGVLLLALGTNLITAVLAGATLASYVFVYTPLKKRTTLNTLVGCVPGALPILGGWTAATGVIEPGALTLFALLFAWQLPHTLALAWLYREDYARGGLIMVGGDDETGRRTAAKATGYVALLAATVVAVAGVGVTHVAGALVALAASIALGVPTVRWLLEPGGRRARAVFVGTIIYLPVVLALLVLGRA